MLQSGDERQLDGLALLIPSLRGEASVLQPDGPVRIGLHPDRVGPLLPGSVVRAGGTTVLDREAPPPLSYEGVEADVGGDPVEPGTQQLVPLEPGQRAPGPQQRLLECVVGVEQRAEHPVTVGVDRRAVGLDEEAERVVVPAADRVDEPWVRRPITGHALRGYSGHRTEGRR